MKPINLSLGAKLLVNLAGVGCISLITLPVGANPPDNQNSSALNGAVAQTTPPIPDLLRECPYNRAACPDGGSSTPPPTQIPPKPISSPYENPNMVKVLESYRSFTILVEALKAAQLEELLKGEGPFTLFAPTDEAFQKLPQEALQDLLMPENKEVLIKLLTYHLVLGKMRSSDLKTGKIDSTEGSAIDIRDSQPGMITVEDATIIRADIEVSNGVIHAIDNIIFPPDL